MEAYQILEQRWAEFNHLDPAGMVVCSSGTSALHLALESFQLQPGSEVLVPDFTMISCARAVTLSGHVPVLIDCNPEDLLINPELVHQALADRPDAMAVMAVHIYGRRCNMYELVDIPKEVFIVEDLAEAHGIVPDKQTDAACWSFYRNKIIAGEEGGAIWFKDPAHAEVARCLRSVGFTPEHDMTHIPRGHNYRMSNPHARIILEAIERYRPFSRREVEVMYDKECPINWKMPRREAAWVYDFRIPGLTAELQNEIVAEMRNFGIQIRHGFKAVHTQQEYLSNVSVGNGNAEVASREVLYLPIHNGITEEEVIRSFSMLRKMSGKA